MEKIRFDLELSEKQCEALDKLMSETNRSRKNLCESLVILAINKMSKNCHMLSLDDLGVVNKPEPPKEN